MSADKHVDRLLRLSLGDVVMVSEPVGGVNMGEGGVLRYNPGVRLRVMLTTPNLMWCRDNRENKVTFDRKDLLSLDVVPT